MKATGGNGRTRKHAGRGHHKKHAASAKHHPRHAPGPVQSGFNAVNPVHVVAKPPPVPKARKLSLGAIDLCPAEAVAACARLAGWEVTAEDVLDLYARCATGPGSGFTIAAALTAASRFGIGGARPGIEFFDCPESWCVPEEQHGCHGVSGDVADDLAVFGHGFGIAEDLQRVEAAQRHALADLPAPPLGVHALILGVDLPGPHALTVAPDGTWWSWGEPFRPDDWPEMVVEEAWLVELPGGTGGGDSNPVAKPFSPVPWAPTASAQDSAVAA